MVNEDTLAGIRTVISDQNALERVRCKGELAFLCLGGSHSYGFATPESDYDLKGAYVAPSERFLGLRRVVEEPVVTFRSGNLEIYAEEIGRFLYLAGRNPLRIELVNSPVVLAGVDDFDLMKGMLNSVSSNKAMLKSYLGAARRFFSGQSRCKGIKRDLHMLRTYMSGITLAREGKIVVDISELNNCFGVEAVKQVLEVRAGRASSYDCGLVNQAAEKLDDSLAAEVEKSRFPESYDRERVSNFLVSLRRKH